MAEDACTKLVNVRAARCLFEDGSSFLIPSCLRWLTLPDSAPIDPKQHCSRPGHWRFSRRTLGGKREGWDFSPGDPRLFVEAALENLSAL